MVVFIYKTRLASKEIFSPSNKIYREVGRAKDLSASLYFVTLTSICDMASSVLYFVVSFETTVGALRFHFPAKRLQFMSHVCIQKMKAVRSSERFFMFIYVMRQKVCNFPPD